MTLTCVPLHDLQVRGSPEGVDVARARAHRQRRTLQVQGVPRHLRRAARHGDGEGAQDLLRGERGHTSRAGHEPLTIAATTTHTVPRLVTLHTALKRRS